MPKTILHDRCSFVAHSSYGHGIDLPVFSRALRRRLFLGRVISLTSLACCLHPRIPNAFGTRELGVAVHCYLAPLMEVAEGRDDRLPFPLQLSRVTA